MSVKTCSDCGVGMEIGYVPNHVPDETPQAYWYPGIRDSGAAIYFLTGFEGEFSDSGLPVVVYRCPECGVLKSYAVERLR